MKTVKAIETQYRGYRFRSRLEARWAVFFDVLGLKWEYEKEGYKLSTGWYLPDFWLSDLWLYVEVKPFLFEKWEHVSGILKPSPDGDGWEIPCLDIVLVEGVPGDHACQVFVDGLDDLCSWVLCASCGKSGFGERCAGETSGRFSCKCVNPELYYSGDYRFLSAFAAARSARFEHGENGVNK